MRELLAGRFGVLMLAVILATTLAIVVNVAKQASGDVESGAPCDCQPMETCECALFNEEHPTIMYEDVEVTRYTHIDGYGGGRFLSGSWGDPFNTSTNTLCSRADDADDATRCPEQCSVTGSARERVGTKRVRRAIGQLSDDEWARVVAAMWEMKNLSEAEGRAKYGPDFRSMDYHNVRHVAAGLPLDVAVEGDEYESDGSDSLQRNLTELLQHLATDVTGGGAQTYPWHALFTMEFETSLLQIDPSIGGLPYIDWGHDVEVTAQRLGQAVLEVPYEMVNRYGFSGCVDTASGRCQMAALADGDFAWWPVTQFNMSSWYASQSESVKALFSELHASGLIDLLVAGNNGQLRAKPGGAALNESPDRVHRQDAAPSDSTPIPYVLRYLTAWETVFANRSDGWNEAVALCVQLDGGLFQDASECFEGRMRVNQFHVHFNAHFIGGDMQFAMVPQDPFFFFHHCGLDRLRRQWQSRNERVRPMAFGYPTSSPGYTTEAGTLVGLYDCLGCTGHGAGFTTESVLGTSPEYGDLPLSEGWLTPADLLCVLDDLYTYDVLLDDDNGVDDDDDESYQRARRSRRLVTLVTLMLAVVGALYVARWHRRHSGVVAGAEMHGAAVPKEEGVVPAYDMSPNDAHICAEEQQKVGALFPAA